MRGRLPKPTALKILEGKPGHRPLPKNEPEPNVGAKAPGWLSIAARKEWDVTAPMLERLGLLTELSAEACAELCTARVVQRAEFQEKGRWNTERWRAIQAMEARFGMTPSDQARVAVKRANGQEEDWA